MKSFNLETITQSIKEKQEKYNKIRLNIDILDVNNFNQSKTWFC